MLSVFGRRIKGMIGLRPGQMWTCNVTNLPCNYRLSDQVQYSIMVSRNSNQACSKGLDVGTFFFFLLWRCDPKRVMASSFLRFLDYTQRRTTVGRTPLEG